MHSFPLKEGASVLLFLQKLEEKAWVKSLSKQRFYETVTVSDLSTDFVKH